MYLSNYCTYIMTTNKLGKAAISFRTWRKINQNNI